MSIERTLSKKLRETVFVWGFLLGGISLFGCGGGTENERVMGAVEITVTYDSKPVTEGSVQMTVAAEGKSSGGSLDASGKVTLSEVQVGKYKVFITPPEAVPGDTPNTGSPKEYKNLPEKFRSETTTSLEAEVKKGSNKFTFELKE